MDNEIKDSENMNTDLTNNNSFTDEENREMKSDKNSKKKKRKLGRTLINIFTFILFVVIVLEAGIGIINMQRISNNEDPIWYLSTNKTETELKTVTEYHLGIYKIVKTDTSKETKITLKPFFLKD